MALDRVQREGPGLLEAEAAAVQTAQEGPAHTFPTQVK